MRSFKSYILSISIVLLIIFSYSCLDDDIGDAYTTATEEMLGEHLQNNPEQYSEFLKMLDTTKVLQMLNAYGEYTCFAPNNNAINDYYSSLNRSSLKDFELDSIKKFVYDHIIKGAVVLEENFSEGRLLQVSMNNRFFSTHFEGNANGYSIYVNHYSPIVDSDIEVHNGVIHQISKVLNPTEKLLFEVIADNPKFKLFAEAMGATGFHNKLNLVSDETYDKDDFEGNYPLANTDRLGTHIILPVSKKYGYTALIESDSVYAENGINNLDDLIAYAKNVYDQNFPEDANITDLKNPKNSLNRFVGYHLINKQLGKSKFIHDLDNTIHSIKTYDMFEYIETMSPNTLLEVRTHRNTSRTTLINFITKTEECIQISEDNYDIDAVNGVFHEIDGILTYNTDVIAEISSKRLRYDAASFFPEFTNNNMRGMGVETKLRYIIPPGYTDRLWLSEGTTFYYYLPDPRLADYQGDEIFLMGLYDFKITTPVVPEGTYEVRMGYQPNGGRGTAQLYWDGIPCGIPLDLRISANDPQIGYEEPGSNDSDPQGFENDKMMHNRGYMKGPASYRSNGEWYANSKVNARLSTEVLRRILGIYTFDSTSVHEFTVRGVQTGQFMLDYLEFVPLEIIEREGID